jgi:putative Holliday junction resolvase
MLGIDFGERRIGLAISDPKGRWAMPLATLERTTDRRAAYEIAALVRREEVRALVLGEPRHPSSGQPQEAVERIRRFGARLGRITGLPVAFQDETLTTAEAGARLEAAGLDTEAHLDAHAAQVILQEALTARTRKHGAEDAP